MKENREPKHSALILAKHCADPSAIYVGSTDCGLGLTEGIGP